MLFVEPDPLCYLVRLLLVVLQLIGCAPFCFSFLRLAQAAVIFADIVETGIPKLVLPSKYVMCVLVAPHFLHVPMRNPS